MGGQSFQDLVMEVMVMIDVVLDCLRVRHPQSKLDLYESMKLHAINASKNPLSLEEFDTLLEGMFVDGKIEFVSKPGQTELGSKPVTLTLDWVDLPKR